MRTIWTRMVVLFLGLLVMVGGVALVSAHYQRMMLERITSDFEGQVGVIVGLHRDITTLAVPIGGVLYELHHRADVEAHFEDFSRRASRIDAKFAEAARIVPPSGETDHLQLARQSWQAAAGEVFAAAELWGTGEVAKALAAGDDPFADTVWQPLREADNHLTELSVDTVDALRPRTAIVNGIQRVTAGALVAAILLALAFGSWSARRLSRRVLMPLVLLRQAATAIRDGDLTRPVALDAAGAELMELAEAMNQMAAFLELSHGRLRDQANRDPLTGVANRKAVTDHLDERLAVARQGDVALLFIDLDDFKVVNDSLGHAAGDELLRIVAGRLQASVREDDVLARLGGDEFAVVVEEENARAAAVVVAERVLAALGNSVTIQNRSVTVGCSIGIAVTTTPGDTGELLHNADLAMYMAKGAGKNRFEVFAPTMHIQMLARGEFKRELAHAADLQQLERRDQAEILTGARGDRSPDHRGVPQIVPSIATPSRACAPLD